MFFMASFTEHVRTRSLNISSYDNFFAAFTFNNVFKLSFRERRRGEMAYQSTSIYFCVVWCGMIIKIIWIFVFVFSTGHNLNASNFFLLQNILFIENLFKRRYREQFLVLFLRKRIQIKILQSKSFFFQHKSK